MNPFLQMAAESMDSKNSAGRNYYGPSYFDLALAQSIQINQTFNQDPIYNGPSYLVMALPPIHLHLIFEICI